MKIVLRIGGSILGSPPDASVIDGYARVVSSIIGLGYSIGVVVGGGPLARQYIEIARKLGLRPESQDSIAIQVSRLNARLVGMKMGSPTVPITVAGMISSIRKNGVAVMGGLRPGITTDTVAALVASSWHSDVLIKCSNQDGIYTADPRVNPAAKLLPTLSHSRLVEILGGKHTPGIHSIVDPVAVEKIARNRLNLAVVDGTKPDNVLRVVLGEKVGTSVS